MNKEFLDKLANFLNEGEDLILAILTRARGSAPQETGAKVIVSKNGLLYGTVGGGKLETKVIAHSKSMLENGGDNDFQEWNLQTEVGMTCGGVVSVFFERMVSKPQWEIALFGAGHVSQELVRGLLRLECSLTVIDPRQEWLDRLPKDFRLKKILASEMASAVKDLNPNCFILSMTMGHAFDIPILVEVFKRNCFPYIGAIGSVGKSKILKNDLLKLGVSAEQLEKLICPVGEDLGNNTPPEIAVSVMAQLLKVRDRK